MEDNIKASASASGGLSFCSALALLFIGLKLGKVIDWSWWWVLSPLWTPLALVVAIYLVVVVVVGVAKAVAAIIGK